MSFKFNIMILIADSGATKTDWCALDKKGAGKPIFFKSEAYNPNYIGGPDIVKSIGAAVPQNFPADEVEEIDIYGDAWGLNTEFVDVIEFLEMVKFVPDKKLTDRLIEKIKKHTD